MKPWPQIISTLILSLSVFSAGVSAGEKDTSFRVGDQLTIYTWCSEYSDLHKVLSSDPQTAQSEWIRLRSSGQCQRYDFQGELVQWMSGNYQHPHGGVGSIWKVRAVESPQTTVYVALHDAEGPHPVALQMHHQETHRSFAIGYPTKIVVALHACDTSEQLFSILDALKGSEADGFLAYRVLATRPNADGNPTCGVIQDFIAPTRVVREYGPIMLGGEMRDCKVVEFITMSSQNVYYGLLTNSEFLPPEDWEELESGAAI